MRAPKFYERKYGLTRAEAAGLESHPRRTEILRNHDLWLEGVGLPDPCSPLSRGKLLDMIEDRDEDLAPPGA